MQSDAESGAFGQFVDFWFQIRAPIVAPIVQFTVNLCLVMVVMMFVECVYMCVAIVLVKLIRSKPETRYKFEATNSAYPKVLVQIPMYNEREVCTLLPKASRVRHQSKKMCLNCDTLISNYRH